MRPSRYKFILSFLLVCVLHMSAFAQDTTAGDATAIQHTVIHTAPSDAQWQQLQHDDAFGYAGEKEMTEDRDTKPHEPNFFEKFLGAIFRFFDSTMGAAILWIGLFLVLAYTLYRIFIGEKSFIFSRSKKTKTDDTGTQNEEDLLGVDWEQRLRTAYEQSDLRLAIRYSYMWLLQLMQERELIQYRNDKTNNDYYRELSETQYKQSFRQLTREYEFAWYGHYPVSNAAYQEYMQLFNAIKTRLN